MSQTLLIALLLVVAAALVAFGVRIVRRLRRNPRERERRRRLVVNFQGRLADGTVTEATESAIFYTYTAGGVVYATSQDVEDLRGSIPVTLESLVGLTITVKYVSKNPANSIIVCEQWSGLRLSTR